MARVKKVAKKAAKKKPAKKPVAKTAARPKAKAVAARPKAKAVAARPKKAAPKQRPMGRNPLTGLPVSAEQEAETLRQFFAEERATTQAAAPTNTIHLVRGAALVDQVMERRRASDEQLEGMSAGEIAAIDFGGKPLSPGLARWLAADREMFTLGRPRPLMDMLADEVGEWADAFVDLTKYLTDDVVVFEGWGSESRRFIYLGATDDAGEYPVFTIDTDDTPFACLNGPVDMWLAQQAGFLPDEETYGDIPPAYEPVRAALATKCFGGFLAHVDGQFSKQLDPYS